MAAVEEEEKSRILEINLISAQGLKIPPSTKTRTYAIAWVDPAAKLRSHLDRIGGENPTWNEKFLFRVSPHFIYGDTSAVQFEIYASGYIRDYLIGNVRFLLSSSSLTSSKTGAVIGTPAFSAVHIRRPSGRVQGVLNIAATVYESSDFAAFDGMSAVCFRDLIGENENEKERERERRRERRRSWHPAAVLSRNSSKRSDRSSGAESSDFQISDPVDFSDGSESTTSSSSSALKEVNGVRSDVTVNGKKDVKLDGKGLLCGLMLQRRFSFCPSDQNLLSFAGFHGKKI